MSDRDRAAAEDAHAAGELRPAPPPPELRDRVRAAVSKSPARTTPVRARIALAALALPLAALAVVLLRHLVTGNRTLRIDLEGMLAWSLGARIAAVAVLTVLTTAIAVWPGRHGLGSPVARLVSIVLASAPIYALLSFADPSPHEVSDHALGLSPVGVPCALIALGVGTITLAALALALRGSVPVAPRWRGAAIGAAAGLWGGLSLFVHCPAHDALHLVVGHVVPVALFAIFGAFATERVLRP